MGVRVATHIPHPDVVAVVGQDVRQTLVGQVRQPVSAGTE